MRKGVEAAPWVFGTEVLTLLLSGSLRCCIVLVVCAPGSAELQLIVNRLSGHHGRRDSGCWAVNG
jgi:hypothetical protein